MKTLKDIILEKIEQLTIEYDKNLSLHIIRTFNKGKIEALNEVLKMLDEQEENEVY